MFEIGDRVFITNAYRWHCMYGTVEDRGVSADGLSYAVRISFADGHEEFPWIDPENLRRV